jgi:hypothetical protein
MVSDYEDWSVSTASWLRAAIARDMPVLGICYGHQLLADALGGQVAYHPQGPEAGVVDVQLLPEAAQDPIFADLPPSFPAAVIHWQSVSTLPPGAVRLAANDLNPTMPSASGRPGAYSFIPSLIRQPWMPTWHIWRPPCKPQAGRQNNCVRNCARHRKRRQYYSVLPACCRNRLPERAAGRASAALAEIN